MKGLAGSSLKEVQAAQAQLLELVGIAYHYAPVERWSEITKLVLGAQDVLSAIEYQRMLQAEAAIRQQAFLRFGQKTEQVELPF